MNKITKAKLDKAIKELNKHYIDRRHVYKTFGEYHYLDVIYSFAVGSPHPSFNNRTLLHSKSLDELLKEVIKLNQRLNNNEELYNSSTNSK